MKVAVILSIYKSDNVTHLEQAIDSIFNQTYENWLLRIMVDGPVSSELTELLQGYTRTSDKVRVFERSNNKGLAHSLNELIEYIITNDNVDYFARMDADDISLKNRLTEQVLFMNDNIDVDVVGSSCLEFGSSFAIEKKMYCEHEELSKYIFKRCPFIHPTVMFRRRVFELGHRYPTNTTLSEDISFWLELLSQGFKFANVDHILLKYRTSENMLRRRVGYKKAISELKVKSNYMKRMKRKTVTNYIYISSYFLLRITPPFVTKLAYKYMR
ncbi:glycosyltransferase [Serratia fonticola]|uniref:Glycosyltransferase n=1 Tax=Serratia fonticola TaxID=47917 RepID=A0AAP2FD73_SERFO|nr:glycosyltransferase [Serratia fonticola]MBC3212851.1 glycosyltransferase [Serratia fonticola]MBP1035277.1 glycosyltransferase [Serratia fonticola]NYA14415.1 glycosyltransferase [Serratia fonticola]NYA34213.1 glycosyltransferase [Serratia fonticola]PAA95938.1 hypothetical protein CJJ13_19920 [Serratia fonticola]